MLKKSVCLLVLHIFLGFHLLAAQKLPIKGNLRDAQSKEPIVGASLYIDGSTIGVASNADGTFVLKGFPEAPYQLTVSSIGYKTAIFTISEELPAQIQLELQADALILKEIKVEAITGGWKQFGDAFLKAFLGTSPFAQKCQLLNPEDLVFSYQDRLLRVYADAPLRIEHQALGYEITYWLNGFEQDYKSKRVFYSGTSLYKDLIPETKRKGKRKRWRNNRLMAYNGSLQHFISSLYKNKSQEEGFEIRALKKVPLEKFYQEIPQQEDSLTYNEQSLELFREKLLNHNASASQVEAKRPFANSLINKIRKWYEDPKAKDPLKFRWLNNIGLNQMKGTYYTLYKDSLKPKRLRVVSYPLNNALERQAKQGKIAVLNNQLLNSDSLLKHIDKSATKYLKFNNYLHITYLREEEERDYLIWQGIRERETQNHQVSLLSLNQVGEVEIFSNGHFSPPYGLLSEQYWAYEKLDKSLPLYFKPPQKK